MRGWKAAIASLFFLASSSGFSFDFNSSYYGVYETGDVYAGCIYIYIVPKDSFLIVGVDQPTPIMFMPQTTGFRATLCPDGQLSWFSKVSLTANDMAENGATLSSYKLYGGDFDGDGKQDFFLQGKDTVRNSVVLTADGTGTPQIYINYYGSLGSSQYPQVNVVDVDRDGRSDLVATDIYGNVSSYISADYAGAGSSDGSGTNTLVGSIDGKFRVDESGNSTYNIDIMSAQGTAGVAPHISLNYSSSSGDGPMGVGWSIGGLSAITRCRQTPVQDQNATAITLGQTDRFCLDGQRLILTSGTYGVNGSTYRTEIDSYATVTIVNSASSDPGNPMGFMVQRKDGSIAFYGAYYYSVGADSQQLVSGKVLAWSISHFSDSVGNGILFSYTNDTNTNEHYITRIDYAYGSDPSTQATSSTYIQFNYESRPDSSSGYVAGAKFTRSERLASIYSYSGGVEIRHYTIAYRTTDSTHYQSYVDHLSECVGSSCLSPTTFSWELGDGGFQAGYTVQTTNGSAPLAVRLIDINGDGRKDLVFMQMTAPYNLYYRLWVGPGFSAAVQFGSVADGNANWLVLDQNNDGYQDLMVGSKDQNWLLYRGSSTGLAFYQDTGIADTASSYSQMSVADVNADGLADLSLNGQYALNQRTNINGSWSYSFGAMQSIDVTYDQVPCGNFPYFSSDQAVDFDGDGRIDFPVFMAIATPYPTNPCSAKGVAVATGDGTYITKAWMQNDSPVNLDGTYLDLNGDGFPDYKGVYNNNYEIAFNNGALALGPVVTLGSKDGMPGLSLGDYNGDGYLDLVYGSNGNLVVRLFNPSTQNYDSPISTSIPFQAASSSNSADQDVLVDIDGDGHTDLLRIQNTASNNVITLYRSADIWKPTNKIVGIDNGLGNTTAITYKSLVDSNVYTKGSGANNATVWPESEPPVFDIVPGSYVVSSVSSTAPTANAETADDVDYGATVWVSYHYNGLKLQASGRGSLGFVSITTTDQQTGVNTTTFYNQTFPLTGQPFVTWVVSSSGVLLKSSVNTYTQVPHLSPDQKSSYYQVYANQVTEATYDPVTAAETSFVVTTTSGIDDWGNVAGTAVSTYNANDHTNFLTQTQTENAYGSTDYDRQFGRLSSTTVHHRRAGFTDSIDRSSSFTYYGSGDGNLRGLLKTEMVSATDAATAETAYSYDAFGNKTKITHSAAGLDDRYEIADYDAVGRYVVDKKSAFFKDDGNGGSWEDSITDHVVSRNAYGQPTRVEGLNGVVTTYQYDVLGRERYRADSSGASLATTYARYGIPGAQYSVNTRAGTGAEATEYFDLLGRSIAKWKRGFDGSWITSETEYDNQGRVKRTSLPHYSGAPTYWATNNYDAYRLQNQIVPATSGETAQTSYAYNGLTTTTTNALGQTRTETRNAAGELTQVVDFAGNTISYAYDQAGQLLQTSTTGQQNGSQKVISTYLKHDGIGRKIQMRDSDKGTWFYQYDGFGDLTDQYKVVSSKDYSGSLTAALADSAVQMQHTHMDYDRRGRMVSRTDFRADGSQEMTATWTYDTASNGVGQLAQEVGGGLTLSYGYDSLGRPSSTMHSDNMGSYIMTVDYDGYGRPQTKTDALGTGSEIVNSYNSYGYLQSVTDSASNTVLYSVQSMDARGNVTSAINGNGTTTSWVYDDGSGLLLSQTATNVLNVTLQKLDYTWDKLGNQKSRTDNGAISATNTAAKGLTQSFCYDGLNRLIKTAQNNSLSGSCSVAASERDQQYDDFGNIVSKSNVGTYTYDAASPHQLVSTGDGVSYTYDKVGNLTSDSSGRTLTYFVSDKVGSIAKSGNYLYFAYGPDRNLYARADVSSGGYSVTTYIGNVEKVTKSDGSYDMKRYLPGGALWIYHYDSQGAQQSVDKEYMYEDVLGSITLIADSAGSIKQELAYGAWGERVDSGDWNTVLPASSFLPVADQFTTHGFTGQDALDAVGLINYGGRIYDPRLGRFVQADPVVQDGEDLQAYNRYAYVRNNPLTLTDPSGFSFWSTVENIVDPGHVLRDIDAAAHNLVDGAIRAVGPQVSGIVVSVASGYCGPWYAACVAAGNYEIARAYGAGFDEALKSGAIAGASAYAFQQVGNAYGGPNDGSSWASSTFGVQQGGYAWAAASVVTNGAVGGVMSVVSGGNFGSGFVSAGFAAGAGIGIGKYHINDFVEQVAIRAAAGGTASKLTGGKFANGALSAAEDAVVRGILTLGGRPPRSFSDFVGKVWSLPNSIIGFAYGGAGYLAEEIGYALGVQGFRQPNAYFDGNALRFTNNIGAWSGAITFGNVEIFGASLPPGSQSPESFWHTTGQHEDQHTYQSQILGPLYLPAAGLSLLAGKVINGDAHGRASFMERGPQQNPPRPW